MGERRVDRSVRERGLPPVAGTQALPYRQLAATVGEFTESGQARDFFFMHKPPGPRVRFRAAEPSGAEDLRAARLFTADSRAWLDVHTAVAGAPAPSGWRVSLTLPHAVFDSLGIVGWEHVGSGRPYGRRPGAGCRAGSARRTGAGPPPVASAPGGCPPRPAPGPPPLLEPGAPPLPR